VVFTGVEFDLISRDGVESVALKTHRGDLVSGPRWGCFVGSLAVA